jgi:hypothetical protein
MLGSTSAPAKGNIFLYSFSGQLFVACVVIGGVFFVGPSALGCLLISVEQLPYVYPIYNGAAPTWFPHLPQLTQG